MRRIALWLVALALASAPPAYAGEAVHVLSLIHI